MMPHGCPGIVMCNLLLLSFVTQSSIVGPTSPSVGEGGHDNAHLQGDFSSKTLLVDDFPIFSDHLLRGFPSHVAFCVVRPSAVVACFNPSLEAVGGATARPGALPNLGHLTSPGRYHHVKHDSSM